MNDRIEKGFSQWIVQIAQDQLLGELDLAKLETPHLIGNRRPMSSEIFGTDLKQVIESTGSPEGSRAYDELAIVFVVAPEGQVREQRFTPTCGHAIEQEDCPTCKAEQECRERSRNRFAEQDN